MANKNTKRIKNQIRIAKRGGKDSVSISGRNFQVTSGSGVVSKNTKRNMQMRILTNAGGGAKASLTVHEKINDREPANPKPKREKKD